MKPLILVTGNKGQLGWELQQLSSNHSQYDFICNDRDELDISDAAALKDFFLYNKVSFFINTAAYTAVDKAETDQENAYKANAEAVGNLAKLCDENDATLITFSTDYVFNGNGTSPYKEDGATEPINYYGYTKWLGEKLALENCNRTIIIRTSWVYSTHGHNFVKTMMKLMKEREELNVVSDQVGTPTYAKDLAEATMEIVNQLSTLHSPLSTKYGIYHFSNTGVISWFDFATAIKNLGGFHCKINAVPTLAYPTPAKRPAYSVLNKEKITETFGIELKHWQQSLQECLKSLV